jgi:hypothetical protein
LPNNQFAGFWRLAREEFDSRHVVCEFKNGAQITKADVIQLRVYLARPSIGRLGMLFHRKRPTPSSLTARRDAYAEGKALILLIDDVTLNRMMIARAFLGSADSLLEDLKMEFELAY